jgi:hypothetical protein
VTALFSVWKEASDVRGLMNFFGGVLIMNITEKNV